MGKTLAAGGVLILLSIAGCDPEASGGQNTDPACVGKCDDAEGSEPLVYWQGAMLECRVEDDVLSCVEDRDPMFDVDALILARVEGEGETPQRVSWSDEHEAYRLDLSYLDHAKPTLVIEGRIDMGVRDNSWDAWRNANRDEIEIPPTVVEFDEATDGFDLVADLQIWEVPVTLPSGARDLAIHFQHSGRPDSPYEWMGTIPSTQSYYVDGEHDGAERVVLIYDPSAGGVKMWIEDLGDREPTTWTDEGTSYEGVRLGGSLAELFLTEAAAVVYDGESLRTLPTP